MGYKTQWNHRLFMEDYGDETKTLKWMDGGGQKCYLPKEKN